MNWILDTYSNVYKTAMMQDQKHDHHVAVAKNSGVAKKPAMFGLFSSR